TGRSNRATADTIASAVVSWPRYLQDMPPTAHAPDGAPTNGERAAALTAAAAGVRYSDCSPPLLASELPHDSEAETRVALHSAFARYAGEFRVGGVLRPRQERRIPVYRRS